MSKKKEVESITIQPPNLGTVEFSIEGVAPYVQHKFSQKARDTLLASQMAGDQAKSRKKRVARDLDGDFEGAQHISTEGWNGMPAPAFRNAMVSACRTVGYVMTRAKLAVFVEPDGFCKDDGTPLVKITKGKPKKHTTYGRVANGNPTIVCRPMWDPGWRAKIRITFDRDMLSPQDVANLLSRVGYQVGIGEGRPDSKSSCGMGWGLFKILDSQESGGVK